MEFKKYIRIATSLLATFIIFALLFRKVSFDTVFLSIKTADLRIVLSILFLSLFNGLFIASLRWKLILKAMGFDLPLKEVFFIKVSSDPVINVFPMKIGEISRVLYLKRINGIPPEKTIFSIFVEYFLNLLAAFFFMGLGLVFWVFGGMPQLVGVKAIGFFCSMNLNENFFKHEWAERLKGCIMKFFKNDNVFKNKNIIGLSFWFGLLEIISFFFVSVALDINLPFYTVLLFLPVVILASSIPVTFLGLGMREGIIVLLFQKYASSQKLLALGIIYSFAEHILPMLIGMVFASLFINKIIANDR